MAERTELPKPIYAAAGAGELAYQQLRRLPDVAVRTAGTLRQRFAGEDRQQLADRVRLSAERGRSVVLERAVAAQQRAITGYHNLITRGQRVVSERAGRNGASSKVEVIVGPVQRDGESDGQSGEARTE